MSFSKEGSKIVEEIHYWLDEIAGEYGDEVDINDDIGLIKTVCKLFKERHSTECDYYKKQYTDDLRKAIDEELQNFYQDKE